MKHKITRLVLAFMALCFSSSIVKAIDEVDLPLQQLNQEILAATQAETTVNGHFAYQFKEMPAADVQIAAARFKAILTKADFSATREAGARISKCAAVARRLLLCLPQKAPEPSEPDSSLLDALKAFSNKLSKNIDRNWKFHVGSANISPPVGVPNAMSGMNPDAIKDPQLRQTYLEAIAEEGRKQIENGQQKDLRSARNDFLWHATILVSPSGKTGWTSSDLLKHFGKDEESKAILTENLKKDGKLR